MLLRVVETVIERLGRVSELREFGPMRFESLRSMLQGFDQIMMALMIPGALMPLAPLRGASLRRFAQGGFHGRPIFLLRRRELQPGLECSDLRVREGVAILIRDLPSAAARRIARGRKGSARQLRQDKGRRSQDDRQPF